MLAILTSLSLLVLSMDWNSLLGWSKGTQEMAQYPDARLYKSATLLKPEERPKVPVRLTDDPVETYAGYGVKRSNFNPPSAFVAPDKKTIYVNRKHKDYKDERILSSKLAHEAHHIANDGPDRYANEQGAAGREIEILSRYARYRELINSLKNAYGIK
jgi:hypothetical protein